MLTPDEFSAWLQDPVTQEVRKCLRKRRADIAELMLGGSYTHANPGETAQDMADAIGECRGLLFAAELDFKLYESEMTDGQQQRVAPEGSGSVD